MPITKQTPPKTPRKSVYEMTVEEAVAEVETLKDHQAKLTDRRNRAADRITEIKRELHGLKSETAHAVNSADLEAMADMTLEERITDLESEARRLKESVKKHDGWIRSNKWKLDALTGRAVEYFDALLADDEAELRSLIEEVAPAVREVHKRWTALQAAKRRLVHCHTAFRAPKKNVPGRKSSDIPEPLEVHGDDPPSLTWLEADLPRLDEWRPKTDSYRQAVQVPMRPRK